MLFQGKINKKFIKCFENVIKLIDNLVCGNTVMCFYLPAQIDLLRTCLAFNILLRGVDLLSSGGFAVLKRTVQLIKYNLGRRLKISQ